MFLEFLQGAESLLASETGTLKLLTFETFELLNLQSFLIKEININLQTCDLKNRKQFYQFAND
jgi:hypothetical protein